MDDRQAIAHPGGPALHGVIFVGRDLDVSDTSATLDLSALSLFIAVPCAILTGDHPAAVGRKAMMCAAR